DSAPSLFHLKAKVYFENQKPELAVDQLNQVLPKKRLVTYRLLSHYLMEMELTREALKVMYEMLDIHGTLNEELHLQSAQLLISKNKVQEAIVLLERASLLFASSADVAKLLAAAYDLDKKPFVAGDLYTKLAYLDSSYSHMAAEYLMQKGRIDRAQVINVMVKNPKEQLTQKLSFYIERERFDLARSLETPLKQYGAYEDDEIKYAMAYTFLMQGDYDHSKGLLKSIKKEKLISKSSKLMELVSECQNNHWECYGTL
ncbi:MAG: tetratricopeptide repeat protein, partial [Bdellovibrionales bacterium]|nr:tetratricopeptide repeat protein [Bdellovibrionales bacterium]